MDLRFLIYKYQSLQQKVNKEQISPRSINQLYIENCLQIIKQCLSRSAHLV